MSKKAYIPLKKVVRPFSYVLLSMTLFSQLLTGILKVAACRTTGGMCGLLNSGRKTLDASWECTANALVVPRSAQVRAD